MDCIKFPDTCEINSWTDILEKVIGKDKNKHSKPKGMYSAVERGRPAFGGIGKNHKGYNYEYLIKKLIIIATKYIKLDLPFTAKNFRQFQKECNEALKMYKCLSAERQPNNPKKQSKKKATQKFSQFLLDKIESLESQEQAYNPPSIEVPIPTQTNHSNQNSSSTDSVPKTTKIKPKCTERIPPSNTNIPKPKTKSQSSPKNQSIPKFILTPVPETQVNKNNPHIPLRQNPPPPIKNVTNPVNSSEFDFSAPPTTTGSSSNPQSNQENPQDDIKPASFISTHSQSGDPDTPPPQNSPTNKNTAYPIIPPPSPDLKPVDLPIQLDHKLNNTQAPPPTNPQAKVPVNKFEIELKEKLTFKFPIIVMYEENINILANLDADDINFDCLSSTNENLTFLKQLKSNLCLIQYKIISDQVKILKIFKQESLPDDKTNWAEKINFSENKQIQASAVRYLNTSWKSGGHSKYITTKISKILSGKLIDNLDSVFYKSSAFLMFQIYDNLNDLNSLDKMKTLFISFTLNLMSYKPVTSDEKTILRLEKDETIQMISEKLFQGLHYFNEYPYPLEHRFLSALYNIERLQEKYPDASNRINEELVRPQKESIQARIDRDPKLKAEIKEYEEGSEDKM